LFNHYREQSQEVKTGLI